MMTSLRSGLESRLGQVIGYFVHDAVAGSGANAVFHISSIQFGRIMYVHLTGNPKGRVLVIQPTVYVGREVITGEGGVTHESAGRIKLVR